MTAIVLILLLYVCILAETISLNFHSDIVLGKNDKEKKKTPTIIPWVQVAPQLLGADVISIDSLAVYNGYLYGGTENAGKLVRWNGANAWVVVAPQLVETEIRSLAVFNGKLYGGTGTSGRLYEWNGVNAWVQVAPQLNINEQRVYSLAVYNGKLYGSTNFGSLLQWNGVNAWVKVASAGAVECLIVFNNGLYGVGTGQLFRWNDVNAWVRVANQLGGVTVYSLAAFNGKLYGGTGSLAPSTSDAGLYEWNGINAWVRVASKGVGEATIFSLAAYNGKLFGGTFPRGKLLMWNGADAWVEMAQLIGTSTITIQSLAVFNGRLYGGTASGRLYEFYYTETTTQTDETSQSIVDSSLEGTRVRTVRHTTDLTPWIA